MSGYIDISGYSKIVYRRKVRNSTTIPTAGMAFYDSSKTFISNSGVPDAYKSGGGDPELHEETIPEGEVYARFTYYSSDAEEVSAFPFVVYDSVAYENALASKVSRNATDISALSGNITNCQAGINSVYGLIGKKVSPIPTPGDGESNLWIGTYSTSPIYVATFKPLMANDTTRSWKYVSVEERFTTGSSYTTIKSGEVSAGETIDLFDVLDTTHAIVMGGGSSKYGYTAAENANFNGFYGTNAVSGGLSGRALAGEYLCIALESENITEIDKNIVIMGDSITNMGGTRSWIANMQKFIHFKSVTKYAHDGLSWRNFSDTAYNVGSYADGSHDNTLWNQVNRLKAATDNEDIEIPDVVLILAGTNDVGNSANIGDVATAYSDPTPVISDSVTTKLTVAESIRFNVELLRSYYPDVQIIIGSPLQRKTYPENVRLMRDAIKECAARLAIGFINQTDESGIDYLTEYNEHKYLQDGLHPNAAGAKIVGEMISLKLQNMIR